MLTQFIVTLTRTQTPTNRQTNECRGKRDKNILFSFIHPFFMCHSRLLNEPLMLHFPSSHSHISLSCIFISTICESFGTHSFGLAFMKISTKKRIYYTRLKWNRVNVYCIVLSPSQNKSRVIMSHFPFFKERMSKYLNCVCAVSLSMCSRVSVYYVNDTKETKPTKSTHTKRIHLE